jgi:hypothetical protein
MCMSHGTTKRLFSQVGIGFSGKRKRAESDTLEDIMFSRINLPCICDDVSRVYLHVFIIYIYLMQLRFVPVSTVLSTNNNTKKLNNSNNNNKDSVVNPS